MKLQDLHPYDSAIVGLSNLYRVDYNGDFFINAPFIVAPNKTISTGNTFVLINSPNSKNRKVHLVGLLDAYFDDGVIFLIVQDILSHETFTINQYIKCPQNPCKWILIDFDYLVEELNTEIIKSYCGSCKDAKKKSVADSNHRKLNDNLLEFDF
jgi:hypothetical protein